MRVLHAQVRDSFPKARRDNHARPGYCTLTQPDGDNLWALRLFYRVDGAEAAAAVDVRVKATLIREVGVTPAALRLIGGPNLSHEITLTDRRATPLEIIAVRSAAGRIAAENGAWAKVDGVWMRKIRVRMAADCPAGRFEETLVIYGRDPDYRELRVTVNGERRDPRRYQLEPAEVALTVTPGKLVPTAIVLLRERDGQPVEIDRVESDDPALQCRFAEGANPTASIRIDVAPDRTPARSSNLTIHVRTPVPQKVVVRVGVHE